jgi:Kef-type K+ transport system membrane component KefB
MQDWIATLPPDLAWAALITLAWLLGELGARWTSLPRVSLYGLTGFVVANAWPGLLPHSDTGELLTMAHVAFGLMLFEFGYRINLAWFRRNPWIGVMAVLQCALVGAAAFALATHFGEPLLPALLLASLALSTSPAGVLRVVNELRSSGQVTERLLHITAVSSVVSVCTFKLVVGAWAYNSSGSLPLAAWHGVVQLLVSAAVGGLFGYGVPAVLRRTGGLVRHGTVGLALGVMLLVAACRPAGLSPVVAALAFGIAARHRRVTMAPAERNFGALGDLLCVALFTYVAATLTWQQVLAGLPLALPLIAIRLLIQVAVATALARVSGSTLRKGLLTGLGLAPMSVFVILLLEHTRDLGLGLMEHVSALAAMTLLLDFVAPWLTRGALILAGERGEPEGR